jgi:hypothetical protein
MAARAGRPESIELRYPPSLKPWAPLASSSKPFSSNYDRHIRINPDYHLVVGRRFQKEPRPRRRALTMAMDFTPCGDIFMFAKDAAIRHMRSVGGLALLVLGACSGGGGSGSMMGEMPMPPPTDGTSTTLMATLDSIQANVFTPKCAGCHSGDSPAVNLNLDATHSYDDLVNVPSTEQPTILRVKPGDPANSFLVQHIESEGDGASSTDLSFIEQWIMEGAQPSGSG